MLMLLFIVAAVGFVASLLPFVFPGTLVSLLGVTLNAGLGELLATTLHVGRGTLVLGGPGQAMLTFQGVLVFYVPLLLLLLFVLRGR